MNTRSLLLASSAMAAMSGIAFAAADKAGSGAAPGKSAAPPPPGASAPAADAAKAAITTAIRSDIPPPVAKRTGPRAGQSLYDFDKLEINGSFGIKDASKTAKKFGSTVTAANHRYDTPVLGADGKPTFAKGAEIKDAAGNVTGYGKGKAIVTTNRKFVCADVDPKTDPDGANLRVWRVAIPAAA